ncbi:CIPK24 [Symbiodinium natans]|uniref:CIPK24 protein n=1 Tax=Symbiodinium natans TaxID=878477 RepID=A0A812PJQ1_9DINO|nr:CIPK24 [Symbiodinium natans]
MNSTMNTTAKPGEWYIMDATGQCVAAFGPSSTEPTVQKCPPGAIWKNQHSSAASMARKDNSRNNGNGHYCAAKCSLICEVTVLGCSDMLTQLGSGGFYCAGGLEPPRSCSSGDHCPVGTGLEDSCPAAQG